MKRSHKRLKKIGKRFSKKQSFGNIWTLAKEFSRRRKYAKIYQKYKKCMKEYSDNERCRDILQGIRFDEIIDNSLVDSYKRSPIKRQISWNLSKLL